jgi:peroxiredoxin Q/BCP
MSLDIRDKAPEFELPGNTGQLYKLSNYLGHRVVVYFYPKDDTSGCTTQACGFRDTNPVFKAANTVLLGISRDSLPSHDKFILKYDLNFPLLSDEGGSVCAAYEVWTEKSMYGKKYFGIERSTFLIDEEGIIQHLWRKVSVPGHVEDVLRVIQKL